MFRLRPAIGPYTRERLADTTQDASANKMQMATQSQHNNKGYRRELRREKEQSLPEGHLNEQQTLTIT